ncbi:hypothetical protein WY13_00793 [Clostridium ljungdahlii]|uniref:Uncharacterized protein n=2 Tax=Clostridium ljungdahlii TaxID=1538 RepID=A0A170NKG5_9CLOT|nr:hypothetical protein WY13_00793 [Clostridium ljungdahlii]
MMIKQLFENGGIEVTDQEFKEILKITTDDIRENRIKFGKRTSLNQMFAIARISFKVLTSV